MSNVQFLIGKDGDPQFAVLPYGEYLALQKALPGEQLATHTASLLSADKTRILLPHGGPNAYLDLVQFADYVARHGVMNMAINQRAQALDKFPREQLNTLDPLIRHHFLPQGSPYKNTMQATTAVVDALVESGLFVRVKQSYPSFFRPVNAIASCEAAIKQFLKDHPKPSVQIDMPAL